MILDASAIVAILLEEPEVDRFLERIERASLVAVGTPTLVEAGLVLARRLDKEWERSCEIRPGALGEGPAIRRTALARGPSAPIGASGKADIPPASTSATA